ncbi:MAG: ABC transporter substrate-binding protein [Proteobacteria bacterium]|nr:ABC transporter substrate-binding protein [Pseudomonadota bacterium]
MKIALPDLVSNSYFPAIAAIELGFFRAEGLDMELELIHPVPATFEALRDGKVDFVAGSAHGPLWAFPGWAGSKVVCSLSQGMYWFLMMRADLKVARGDLSALRGRRIVAAGGVDLGFRGLLQEAGIDTAVEGIEIGPLPGGVPQGVSFGVAAVDALAAGTVDGLWANGMAAEKAVTSGVASIVLDVRRGDGPPAAFLFTQPALVTTDRLIAEQADAVAAAVRAIVKTQKALKADPGRATEVAEKLFPPLEAGLIRRLIERDLPYYDPAVTEEFTTGMSRFAQMMGMTDAPVPHDDIVASQYRDLWKG